MAALDNLIRNNLGLLFNPINNLLVSLDNGNQSRSTSTPSYPSANVYGPTRLIGPTLPQQTGPSAPPQNLQSPSTNNTQQQQKSPSGGLSEDDLRRIGFNDPNVIRGILNDPNQRAKYERELGISSAGDSVNQVIQKSFQDLQNEVISRFKEYRADKPFRVDEVLAEKAAEAKEQIDPYYDETLSDYLLGVTRKISRGQRDTQDVLNELSAQTESFTGEAKTLLDESINKARQGFAESGLFSSGERLRREGKLQGTTENQLQDFLRGQRFKERTTTNELDDLIKDTNLAKTQTVRNIERQRTTDIEQRKGQLAQEAGRNFVLGFKQTLPTELQATTGFDLLGDLGL